MHIVECRNFDEVLLRDGVVCGLENRETQRKLLEVPFANVTLDRALTVALAHKSSMQTQQNLHSESVNAIRYSSYRKAKMDDRVHHKPKNKNPFQQSLDPTATIKSCKFCGGPPHVRERCLARGKVCLVVVNEATLKGYVELQANCTTWK